MTDSSPSPSGPALRSVTREDLLALSPEGTPELRVRAERLGDALRAARQTSFTVAAGRSAGLLRTYRERLAQAREQGVPTVGIQELLDLLADHDGEHLWGFTVRDDTLIYVGFADQALGRLLAVVIIARAGAEAIIAP